MSLTELAAEIRRMGHWLDDAACNPQMGAMFDNSEGGGKAAQMNVLQAKRVCYSCPVIIQCREYSLTASPRPRGVWGGLTTEERTIERRKVRRVSRAAKASPTEHDQCGTEQGYHRHQTAIEMACADCRRAHARYRADRRTAQKAATC